MGRNRKILIVDGYNVLRCGDGYSNLTTPDWTDDFFNFARDTLINDVALVSGRNIEATIVFDGTENILSKGERMSVGGVDVIFSKKGVDADQTIINMAVNLRQKGYDVTVVSSDASVQNSVMGHGVARMSANEFCKECKTLKEDVEQSEPLKPQARSTIKSAIDKNTLNKLLEIRDDG